MTDVDTRPRNRARGRRLALAAAATLAATVWAAVQDDDAPLAPVASRPRRPGASAAPVATLAASAELVWPELARVESRVPWHDPLAQGLLAWGPPPPPPAPAAAPPTPAPSQAVLPPDFPYTLIGRLDDGQARALLTNRTRSFGAKAADVIDGTWRVDAVNADGVSLTWLPGGISRTLAFPS